ncbi:MAG: DUF4446 family protein [Nitriliruptorales bacterium]|nr:DUF4446 family protein [Nitriliruptorales bacterium]
MVLADEVVGAVVVTLAAATVLLIFGVTWIGLRLRRLQRAYASAIDPERREDLFQSVERQSKDLASLREDLGVVHGNTEVLRDLIRGTVSRVGLVRYDAFEDMGGALSFSAAMLDEDGHGVVISAINGRSETRAYAKAVRNGQSEHNLSTEEQAAIEEALSGPTGDTTVQQPRSRRGRRAS